MIFSEFSVSSLCAVSEIEKKAAALLIQELVKRSIPEPNITEDENNTQQIVFFTDKSCTDYDAYKIRLSQNTARFEAGGIRGFIYAIGLFLRKSEFKQGRIFLTADIEGDYAPVKKIRGHQLGYRPLSNTYDKWTVEDYRRYYLDLMYFGANTVEHIAYEKGVSRRNTLMQYDEEDLLAMASQIADEYNLNVSLWAPNCEESAEEGMQNRTRTFGVAKRLNDVFVPGSDPGELAPSELIKRATGFSKVLKSAHPGAKLWVSAQQPHSQPDWGKTFIDEFNKLPSKIDGVITGPNHAFLPDTLRRKLPQQYPIRFYPDITHNVRCEYPVHFMQDDWHYALSVVNSRESVNPRLSEYALLHKLTHRYFEGSVSYSEGVNDDINKALYSALEYNPETSVRETAEDYARLFFFGSNIQTAADAILGLEKNWEGNPAENPQISATYNAWCELLQSNPALKDNWRWVQGMFRAECDLFVREKLLYETDLIKTSYSFVKRNQLDIASGVLKKPLPSKIGVLRNAINLHASQLFGLIGQQLGTQQFFADSWERGAVLDTCDLPITDITYLQRKFEYAQALNEEQRQDYLLRIYERNKVESDEYYYSFALAPLNVLGISQTPEFYMDFQGDRPHTNNGDLPVCLFRLFDHFEFRFVTGGLKYNTDYYLTVTYKDSPNHTGADHVIKVNGHEIYHGEQFGGTRCKKFESEQLPDGYTAVSYPIKAQYIQNGCIELNISEPHTGFEIAEFRLTKKPLQ